MNFSPKQANSSRYITDEDVFCWSDICRISQCNQIFHIINDFGVTDELRVTSLGYVSPEHTKDHWRLEECMKSCTFPYALLKVTVAFVRNLRQNIKRVTRSLKQTTVTVPWKLNLRKAMLCAFNSMSKTDETFEEEIVDHLVNKRFWIAPLFPVTSFIKYIGRPTQWAAILAPVSDGFNWRSTSTCLLCVLFGCLCVLSY